MKFQLVQTTLANNKGHKKPPSPSRYPYVLSGLVQCKTCGDRLCVKSAHGNGGKIGYYEHAWSVKTQSCLSKKLFTCEPHRIQAKIVEPAVWSDVKRLLLDEAYAREIFDEAKKLVLEISPAHEIEKLKTKASSLQLQIEATTERVSQLPKEIDAKSFFDQILKLQQLKLDIEAKIASERLRDASRDAPLSFADYQAFVGELRTLAAQTTDPDVQAQICRRLIEKVEVSTTGITIHYHVGAAHYADRSIESSSQGLEVLAKPVAPRPFFISKPLQKYADVFNERKKPICQTFDGSNSLTNGRG